MLSDSQATLSRHLSHPVKNGIPAATSPGHIVVTDEHGVTIGSIVESDGSHFAFNAAGELLGEYESRRRAIQALPLRGGRP
jgi:hypothetical protein